MEILALVHFADRMIGELRAYGSPADRLVGVEHGLNQRLANAIAANEALRGSSSGEGSILRQLEGGALHIFPVSNFTAHDLVSLLVGELGLALADYLRLCEPEFQFLAAEMHGHTDQVEEGMPILLRYVGPSGKEENKAEMSDFPVIEMAALGATFELMNSGNDEEAILNVLRTRLRRHLFFGEASASHAQ